jgi:hypothetical protein
MNLDEDAMYAAYAQSIEVPPMWDAIETRLRPRRSPWRAALAMAAMLTVIVAIFVARDRSETPASIVAAHYRDAIAARHASADAATLLPRLDASINTAEQHANADDPIAVTRVVSAYDAKLQLLRATSHD